MALRLLIALGMVLSVSIPVFAAQRFVVVEDFTNTACSGCNVIKDSVDAIFETYKGQVAPIRIHVNWPSPVDPIFLWNPVDALDRRAYYNVSYVPTIRFDGMVIKDYFDFGSAEEYYAFVRSTLDSLLTVPSPLRINLEHHQTDDSVYVSADLVVEDVMTGGQNIHLVVTESWVNLDGYGFHFYPMRDFVPDANPPEVYLRQNDSVHVEWKYAIPDSGIHRSRLWHTVIVQQTSNKQIRQGTSELMPRITAGVAGSGAPPRLALEGNLPNPFNPETTIRFHVDRSGPVCLAVYTQAGRLVTDLVSGPVGAGSHSVVWDGRDRFGREVGSGIYHYRLVVGDAALNRKMVLIR